MAEKLEVLLGFEFDGLFDSPRGNPGSRYFVPCDTLCDLGQARRLGIHGADDLFGGVVPRPFVATKLISHPLPRLRATHRAAGPAPACSSKARCA